MLGGRSESPIRKPGCPLQGSGNCSGSSSCPHPVLCSKNFRSRHLVADRNPYYPPKGPFRTKNSAALQSVLFCHCRSFSVSVPFSCLFFLEKQALLSPLRSVLLRPYRIYSPNSLSVVFLVREGPLGKECWGWGWGSKSYPDKQRSLKNLLRLFLGNTLPENRHVALILQGLLRLFQNNPENKNNLLRLKKLQKILRV